MLGNVEISHLKEGTLYNLVNILDTNDDWKIFMSQIPKDLQNENSGAKYSTEDINLIENHSRITGGTCAKILFDEWGTSGRVRPTLTIVKQIAMKAGMLRLTDEIARILGEDPPPRPQTGPGAPVDTDIDTLNGLSTELICEVESRNNLTTDQIQSDHNTTNNKLQAQTTAQMMSESDMIKFSQTVELVIGSGHQMQNDNRNESNNTFQGCTTRQMKSASDLIKFPESNMDMQTSASSEDQESNLPAWSQIMNSPHTLNNKAYVN